MNLVKTPVAACMCCERHLDECTTGVLQSAFDGCMELPADVLARCLPHPFQGSQIMNLVKTPVAACMCCERHLDECTTGVLQSAFDGCMELPADVLARCLPHPFQGSQIMNLVKTPVAACMCCERHLDECTTGVLQSAFDGCMELPADVLARCLPHPFQGSQIMNLVKTPVAACMCCERHLDECTTGVLQSAFDG